MEESSAYLVLDCFGKYLDENSAIQWRYENTDVCADSWRGYQYHSGSAPDLRHVWIAGDGDRGSRGCYGAGTDATGVYE